MPTVKSPIKRHGGKRYLAARIVSLIPADATHYHEPFFGSGAVLFAKPPRGSEVVNDLDGELTTFWQVLRDPSLFDRLHRYLAMTPLSRFEFEQAQLPSDAPVERAARFFIRNRQSRQALGRDYVTPTTRTRRGMNEHASAWLSAVDGLPAVYERLRTVEIDCLPAVESIRRRDHAGCLHYCDPPYVHETRTATAAYQHEMTEADHWELLQTLAGIRGRFLLSGYHCDLYDQFAEVHRWDSIEFQLPNHASGRRSKETKTEVVWSNYPLAFLSSNVGIPT